MRERAKEKVGERGNLGQMGEEGKLLAGDLGELFLGESTPRSSSARVPGSLRLRAWRSGAPHTHLALGRDALGDSVPAIRASLRVLL